jgi:hypothetical protein
MESSKKQLAVSGFYSQVSILVLVSAVVNAILMCQVYSKLVVKNKYMAYPLLLKFVTW